MTAEQFAERFRRPTNV